MKIKEQQDCQEPHLHMNSGDVVLFLSENWHTICRTDMESQIYHRHLGRKKIKLCKVKDIKYDKPILTQGI